MSPAYVVLYYVVLQRGTKRRAFDKALLSVLTKTGQNR